MPWKIYKKRHLTSFQVIILGFAGVILFGALILMLPISSVQGIITPFHKALFTSTSAVCVTGLAVVDTGSYWSAFGQTVIMILIQIGGLGVITTATAVFILSGRKISIMLLIIIGGIGFFTWEDIYLHKFRFKHYHMQSKIILTTTLCLILLPAVFFFFQDYGNLSGTHRLLASLFQAVTPRTAGFNTTDLSMLTGASKAMMILLMLIGGSPSSTAGGMKTTTFVLLLLNVLATFQSRDDVTAFGRRIDVGVIKNAATIAMMYFILFFAGGMTISVYEGLPLSSCLFEAASAVGTVGLTLGITPKLHILSQIILIILMYLGRVGGLTLIYAVFSDKNKRKAKLPLDKIIVG
ncbi:MAG: TrkH family potassium uptake protein [Anaerostipes hadrus]